MRSALLMSVEEGGHEAVTELAFEPVWYGVIALGMFLALLALLWSFRNTLALDPAEHHHDDLSDGSSASHH